MKTKLVLIAMGIAGVAGISSSAPKARPTSKFDPRKGHVGAKNPKPAYKLREGRFEGLPSVMIVNESLKGYQFKSTFPWHLHVRILMKETNAAQLPTRKEAQVLNEMEDEMSAALGKVCRFRYIGRTSWKGSRELFFYLDSPQAAQKVLRALTSAKPARRELEYGISADKTWSKVAYFFTP